MKQWELSGVGDIPAVWNQVNAMLKVAFSRRLPKAYLALGQEPFEVRDSVQNRRFHALIGDIAASVDLGRKFSPKVWKAKLVDEFEQELAANGETLPKPSQTVESLDGRRLITIRASTKNFTKPIAAQFIQFLYAFGVQHGAVFREKSIKIYEEVRDVCIEHHARNEPNH